MGNSYDDIKERMKNRLKSGSSKIDGSFAMDIISAVAYELSEIIALKVDTIIDSVMLDTAQGSELDRKAADFNLQRNEQKPARGIVKVKGVEGSLIAKGSILVSDIGLEYITTESAELKEGVAVVNVECLNSGSIGNVESGRITGFKDTLTGISEVVNEAKLEGGTDRETDEAFRMRIMESRRKPVTAGNINHYIAWAKEVPGVLKAKVIPLYNGNGTVKVILLSSETDVVDSVVLHEARKHIENNRPIGASVLVESAIPKLVSLNFNLELSDVGHQDVVKRDIEEAVKAHLKDIAFDDSKPLSYYKIGDIVFGVDGVRDIKSYTINGARESLNADINEFFKLSEVLVDVG